MAKYTRWMAQMTVVPNNYNDPEGNVVESKALLFHDLEAGEQVIFPLDAEFVKEVIKKLKMNNKVLVEEMEEERRRQMAQQMLAGTNGEAASPKEQAIVRNIMGRQKGGGS